MPSSAPIPSNHSPVPHYQVERTCRFAIPPPPPGTVDKQKRTVDITAITDKPIPKPYGPGGKWVNSIILIPGIRIPATGRVPLLDSHLAISVQTVLGSVGEFRATKNTLSGTVLFASTPFAVNAFTNFCEGHLTDFSVRVDVLEGLWVPENKTEVINDRKFLGPVLAVTKSYLREVSLVIWGADSDAKATPP